MSQVTELVVFAASEAYQKDNTIVNGLVDILNKTPGKINTFHGPQVEDPNKGYLFVNWESLEHHKALMASPDYPTLVEGLKPALAGDYELVHVKFDKDPTPALSAPVTEVVAIQIKEGKSEDELKKLLEQGAKIQLPGVVGSTYGPIIEKPGCYIMAVGWPSVEEHQAARQTKSEESTKVLGGVLELADFKVGHAKLTKY
ncbi:hypothetical protein GLOTRDRAFT_140239 [Gloeophyllum trabeum ATCC 11539]|uniref:ABM domain-containing protein n=1 Tax=Gloeophyllum trabeum (strain ATCC 11539 / FP-39264 / Madison 617) TaxID=670483 RepID=S7PY21_GLOTA|nr:uncharacterized protein GLOTRDRAFT_140239 [Gloeophyllum trabeum ATCC 11539]EPQ52516.1 hypothetical protein GLOTRDRAFT_140239 [Gloeophyllum trabeum ATCC 11539]|eukprot:PLAT6712.1.p1 GENE.PLAT6712.1~~PLAT6712.1.p1  ORF type:complete len:200 (-),score=13.49 PLAT6712.1:278-877(-)